MKTLPDVIEKIKEFEGLSLVPYKCPAGKSTIGYGHVITCMDGYESGISINTANTLLRADIESVETQLDVLLVETELDVNIYQYSSLVSFTYNLGINNTRKLITGGYKGHTRTISGIAKKMNEYVNANGKPLSGLVKRRKWESDFFMKKNGDTFEITKIQYMIKPNYNVREEPSTTAKVLVCYPQAVYVEVIDTCVKNGFVKTNRGYVHKSAFYDNFM